MTRKLKCVLLGLAVVCVFAAQQAGATPITVDQTNWTMSMNYDSVAVPPDGAPTTVDYNINGTAHNDVALTTYADTTGGLGTIYSSDGSAAIGWNSVPQSGSVSWTFQALSGGTGTFTAFSFNPVSVRAFSGTTVTLSALVNGSEVYSQTYDNEGLDIALSTINLTSLLGGTAHTVEIVWNMSLGGNVNWWDALAGRVTDIGNPGLTVNASASAVPEPGAMALLAAGLMALTAYAWRKRK